jgi:hypothetical protein
VISVDFFFFLFLRFVLSLELRFINSHNDSVNMTFFTVISQNEWRIPNLGRVHEDHLGTEPFRALAKGPLCRQRTVAFWVGSKVACPLQGGPLPCIVPLSVPLTPQNDGVTLLIVGEALETIEI